MRTLAVLFVGCAATLAAPVRAQPATTPPLSEEFGAEPEQVASVPPWVDPQAAPVPEDFGPPDPLEPGGRYARAGLLEAGGSAGVMFASDFRNVSLSPSIGWFVVDNVQISTIFGLSNIEVGDEDATAFTALVEPSYHLPLDDATFALVGMGLGGAYVSELGGGLAVATRLGVQFLVGHSGILTPALSYDYIINHVDGDDTENDVALDAVLSAVRINVGYTTIW